MATTTTKQHPLLAQLAEENKTKLTDKAKTILSLALGHAEKRKGWIEQRRTELKEIDEVVEETLKAYDKGDEARLSELRDRVMVYSANTFKETRRAKKEYDNGDDL